MSLDQALQEAKAREYLQDHIQYGIPPQFYRTDVADVLFKEAVHIANDLHAQGKKRGLIALVMAGPVYATVEPLIDLPPEQLSTPVLGDRRELREALYAQVNHDSALLVIDDRIIGMGVPLIDYTNVARDIRQAVVPPSWRQHKRHSTAFINAYLGPVVTMSEETGTVRLFNAGGIAKEYQPRTPDNIVPVEPPPVLPPTGTDSPPWYQRVAAGFSTYLF